jgi:hypothetical protein
MADDLEDFDLEPTRKRADEQTVRPYRPGQPGDGPGFPAILALVAVVAVGLLAVLFFVFRQPATPRPTPSPAAVAGQPGPQTTPTPDPALPPLDDSDAFVRRIAAGLSAHPELARWLSRTALVRTLAAVVVNVAAGETPRPHLEFLTPKQRFRALRRPGRRLVPDPAGFAGYDLFGDTVASVDAAAAASAYRALAPVFEAAYVELGHPEGGFRSALDTAIAALLAVPVLGDDVALVPHAIGFRYVDSTLESLTPAQKQFLRTGPRNVRLVQAKLRELAAALTPPPLPAVP